jgi:cyanophycinase
LRCHHLIGGTPCARLIRERNAAACRWPAPAPAPAILSEHMIAFGDEGGSPRAGSVAWRPGSG